MLLWLEPYLTLNSIWKVLLCITTGSPVFLYNCLTQSLPRITQGFMDHSKDYKETFQYLIYILTHLSIMHGLHAYSVVEHPHILHSNDKYINIHTLQIHKHTHEPWGVRIYCILSVRVQQGLCAAAAVGQTSLQNHCYSSSKVTGTEFTQAVQLWHGK